MKTKVFIPILIAIIAIVAITQTAVAQTSVNTVVSALWKRYSSDLYTSPATLDMSIVTGKQIGRAHV